jgi:hypothetical protein
MEPEADMEINNSHVTRWLKLREDKGAELRVA